MSEIESQPLHDALAAELRSAQAIAHIHVRTWAERALITDDSVYRILRGRRPVSVVELILLCRALGDEPLDLISRAIQRAGQSHSDLAGSEATRAERARLALHAAGLQGDLDAAFLKARDSLSEKTHLLSRRDWDEFVEGTASTAIVSALATFLEVPVEYLAGHQDLAASRVESQLKFARTMHDIGVTRLAARSLGELQPDEIHAVEAAIRGFIDEEEGP
jgi:transcriptional regulator with XRE-family HTH domain